MPLIGILSDSHLQAPNDMYRQQCARAFAHCEQIIHAGDLTDLSVLSVFEGKKVHAVHGNMCNAEATARLGKKMSITVGNFSIAISHGAGARHNIEERVFQLFPEADCIVFGHSHQPVCHYFGKTLMINPGSFQSTGRYGATGSYGLLHIGEQSIKGSIHYLESSF
jgi:putative phosphoesterase